jgi:CheY-like chemotaxis protein
MQQIPHLRCIPIIAVSAGVSQSDQADSMSAGAKAFLTKPIENASMLLEIGNLLDLTWTFAPSRQMSPTTHNLTEQFVVPEPAAMESLRELSKAGNMRAIREKADQLAALDIRYRPFAEKISVLALGYQSKAVLRLVEKHATPKQVNQS